jgi:hypothetical protein
MNKKTYIFDIDGTICTNTYGNYIKAEPIIERIKIINNIYDSGNIIIFLTARGMGSSNNNYFAAYSKWYDFTEKQLKSWNIKFHYLYFGKPQGDFYIDDKAITDKNFFNEIYNLL